MTKNSDDYDKNFRKVKLNSEFNLKIKSNKIIVIPPMTIVVRAVFIENNKYYLQAFFR